MHCGWCRDVNIKALLCVVCIPWAAIEHHKHNRWDSNQILLSDKVLRVLIELHTGDEICSLWLPCLLTVAIDTEAGLLCQSRDQQVWNGARSLKGVTNKGLDLLMSIVVHPRYIKSMLRSFTHLSVSLFHASSSTTMHFRTTVTVEHQ